MKTYLCAFAMCQSMFCAIPFPGRLWDEKARGKMLLFLPVVGLEIGLVWAALAWAVRFLKLPALVGGLALCACPFLLTGFIHLDGFMDVTDAVKSWRDLEKRRAILKDSHVGSFAVIGLCLLMLSQFAFFSAASEGADFRILLFIPAVSRCCSALAVRRSRRYSTLTRLPSGLPRSASMLRWARRRTVRADTPRSAAARAAAAGAISPARRWPRYVGAAS